MRRIAFLLVLTMLGGLLSACGENDLEPGQFDPGAGGESALGRR
jgi:hypothetical protein